MTTADTLRTLVAKIAEIDEAEVDPSEDLLSGGLLDSMGVVRLIESAEGTFGVQVPDTDLVPENFRSVEVMARYFDGLAADT